MKSKVSPYFGLRFWLERKPFNTLICLRLAQVSRMFMLAKTMNVKCEFRGKKFPDLKCQLDLSICFRLAKFFLLFCQIFNRTEIINQDIEEWRNLATIERCAAVKTWHVKAINLTYHRPSREPAVRKSCIYQRYITILDQVLFLFDSDESQRHWHSATRENISTSSRNFTEDRMRKSVSRNLPKRLMRTSRWLGHKWVR